MRIVPLALLAALALPLPMLADTYTYTYTGNALGSLLNLGEPQVFNANNSVIIAFTLSAPLADNLTGFTTQTNIPQISSTASDGYQTFISLNTTVSLFLVDTDATGKITSWNAIVGVVDGSGTQYLDQSYYTPGPYWFDQALFDASSPNVFARAQNTDDQGKWTVTDNVAAGVTPEPSSFILLGTGMMGVAVSFRRKLAA
jgi:hypothetical protein